MALAARGTAMYTYDHEFDRLQGWFTPKRIKRILREWHARYEPWVYQHPDERGQNPRRGKSEIQNTSEMNQAAVAGAVQSALNQLAMDEPELYGVVFDFYFDVVPVTPSPNEKPHEIVWEPRYSVFQMAEFQGCSARTIYRREFEARMWLAKRLGWKQWNNES